MADMDGGIKVVLPGDIVRSGVAKSSVKLGPGVAQLPELINEGAAQKTQPPSTVSVELAATRSGILGRQLLPGKAGSSEANENCWVEAHGKRVRGH